MSGFILELPTKIYFGEGITEQALKAESRWIRGNVLLVTSGRSLERLGYVERLKKYLEDMDQVNSVAIFDRISPNPRLEEAEQAARLGREARADCVIGFGGGSALDGAKAAAVGIGSGRPLEAYLIEGREPEEETLPVIAIPTTAGTGSELSRGAILTSQARGIKTGIRGKNLLPKAAIVDPAFTWSVPLKVTVETGFDVLSHGIESLMAKKANRFTRMLSEQAIATVADNLPFLTEYLREGSPKEQEAEAKEAREAMSYASMLMGINLAEAGTCLPHRIQYPVGAMTDTSHGRGLAALYPAWIRQEYEEQPELIKKALFPLEKREAENAGEAGAMMSRFLGRLGLSASLGKLGIQASQLPKLEAEVTGSLDNDRLSRRGGIVRQILEQSL